MIRICRAAAVGALMALCGCGPKGIEDGLTFYADQYRVRDAAARRAESYWFLRFDELVLSDLDDAIRAGREGRTDEMRRLGTQAVRAAASLARQAGDGEIDRLPPVGRAQLAKAAGQPNDPAALKQLFHRRAGKASSQLLSELQAADETALLDCLTQIRRAVEALPDDQGRAGRQLLFAWGVIPAWVGVEAIERKMERRADGEFLPFKKGVTFFPAQSDRDELVSRYAPILMLESPEKRDYPADSDRFGEIYLTGDPSRISVHVNTSKPTAYAYRSQAKINGKRYPQVAYVWWFPERPSMTSNDPVAGRIDGDTLRITLDSRNRPAVFEVVQGCGCGHLVYVAEFVEQMAADQFRQPEPGKQLVVERDVGSKRDLIVSGTVRVPEEDCRPVVYVVAGYHAVSGLRCRRNQPPPASGEDSHFYRVEPYDQLDHLALGDGFGSMFGADGLVHDAGRREGYLLAPTGMLSAGQPRKRGTQKIRWDEYNFEDPRLLEKALRLPSGL